MSRPSLATPCPAPHAGSSLRRLSVTSLGGQDDTAELEYTRAITQEFKNAKPRRRSTFQRRERKDAPITIFEDVVEDQELVVAEPRREIGGSVLLGKAARKMPRSSMMSKQQETIAEEEPTQDQARSRRRVSTMADSVPGLRFKTSEPQNEVAPETKAQGGGLKKDPRRRTIFVPSDDTTMMTIHPGANTTDRLNDTFQLSTLPQQHEPPAKKIAVKEEQQPPKVVSRKPRMSLAVAPKRLPLSQVVTDKNNVSAIDAPGQNGGKENLPPRIQVNAGEKKLGSRLYAPTAASQARGPVQARNAVPLQKTTDHQRQRTAGALRTSTWKAPVAEPKKVLPSASSQRPSTQQRPSAPTASHKANRSLDAAASVRQPKLPFSNEHKSTPPSNTALKRKSPIERPKSLNARNSKLQQYPVLSGDLAQPDLYEDDWLRHQEVALTEVINQILSGSHQAVDTWHDPEMTLRDRLVEIYHQPQVSTLLQRIQASLLCGALSRPKDLPDPTLPSQDIGLRKRFLGLWLDSYHEDALRNAAEVVIGRQIPYDRDSTGGAKPTLDSHHKRRCLIAFLETFFIELQDITTDLDNAGRWKKMVSRSLMLIWLLDQAKISHAIDGCLFKASSTHKTSASILRGLASLLIPSIGDVARTMRHMDYELSHQQDPLDEITYRVTNIATDMRDGVYLARLVQQLLFSDQNMRIKGIEGPESTVTIAMPDLEMLQSGLYGQDGERSHEILSRHLKMPCLGRAPKVYNVGVSLSALASYGRKGEIVCDIMAEDIVNGHREKTLSLLWSLVSTYGLESLIDFRELSSEIRNYDTNANVPDALSFLSQYQQEWLLQTWATVVCARHDVQTSNLTTSFSDGKAYAAIVESYAPFANVTINKTARHSRTPSSGDPLSTHLHILGCSTAFTSCLSKPHIPSRLTTLSNLAFLAARLLPLKRRHNAACTIQRAYRLRRSKTIASQRVALIRIAHACATVVQTQQRLVGAAIVLQRAWRGVVEARIKRLDNEAEGFQTLAKGWLVRRKLMRERKGLVRGARSWW